MLNYQRVSWGFVHDFPRDFNRDLDFQVVVVFLSDWPLSIVINIRMYTDFW